MNEDKGKQMIEEPEYVLWCEACDVKVTLSNASKHPDGLGGHVITRWVKAT